MTPSLTETKLGCGALRVNVRIGGDDPVGALPVVLVHGAVISGRYMTPTAERIAVQRQVLVPDLPGFGRSDDPPAPYDVPELASALARIMDAAGIARAHVLGNSLGAQVAAELAASHPQRVASAILVGPTVDAAARTRVRTLWRLAKDAFVERPSLIPLHLIDIARAGWRFAVASLDVALADAIEEKLPRVSAPVLIVVGDRDPLVPREWAAWLATLTPCAELTVMEGPHALNYSRPAELTPVVLDFIERVERTEG